MGLASSGQSKLMGGSAQEGLRGVGRANSGGPRSLGEEVGLCAEPGGRPSGSRERVGCHLLGLGPSESTALGIWSQSAHGRP